MTSIDKAKSLASFAKEKGWTGEFEFDYDQDYAKLNLHRGKNEDIIIEWVNNQLNGPPTHIISGIDFRLHCAATARRVIENKPDIDKYTKRVRELKRAARRTANDSSESEVVFADDLVPDLPFDINAEGVDSEVLRMCRGATLIWRNRLTGLAERAYIPRESNRDLKNTYFIGESSTGRPYLSFKSESGVFRAVAFDQMLQVR